MLLGLTIRDVVLIDRLGLVFRPGLCVLTGETGAGKSILLDALGLALGRRADAGLVRAGAKEAAVTAEFALGRDHPAWSMLGAAGLNGSGESIVLRRLLGADGKSRAFVNDEPTSVGLLRELGASLVEIQGQFEPHGLFDPANHRAILDAYAGIDPETGIDAAALAQCWQDWREAVRREESAARLIAESREEEDLLRHHLAELDALAPQPGEEDGLAARRALLQNAERLAESLTEAIAELDGEGGAQAALARALRRLERVRERAQGLFDPAFAAAERAVAETAEALAALEAAARALALDPRELDRVEERLFALRALARKHQVPPDALPRLQTRIADRLQAIAGQGERAADLARANAEARARFAAAAEAVSRARTQAARRLDKAVAAELEPLRLVRARFRTVLAPLDERDWGEHGVERVHFEV
ncbi:MAG: AAA family ATPase, partial [Stellaceae bacterium]